jgi:hypothetical protein
MRRLCAQLIIAGVTAFAIGVKRFGSSPLFQFAAQRAVATVAAPRGNCVASSGDGNRRLSNRSGLTGGSL